MRVFKSFTQKNPFRFVLLFLLFVLLGSCNYKISVPESPYPISEDQFQVQTLAEGFVVPYGLAILGDSEYLISDRNGKLFHFKDSVLTEIEGMPDVITFGTPGIPAIMHGGLMELSLHPNYAKNGWVYACYLPTDGHATVSRFKVKGNQAVDFEPIFKTRYETYTGNGMRIVWEDSTHFFLNIGNSNLSTYANPVMYAQDMGNDMGKIHRLKENGSIPKDNPIFKGFSEPQSIWSFGHRDVQGLVYDKSTHTLFGIEHGPKGGDEFNIIEKGKNYGWPLFSYGINYDGMGVSMISEDSAAKFTVFPEHSWTVATNDGGQAIAPACLLKVDNSNIPDWNGYFLIGSLAYRRLMKYDRNSKETFGLGIEGRVRTIKQLPNGDLIALVERNDLRKNNGKMIRIFN
ncbi:PQQ-dependent sugar dehydrogenase [Algoriphagus sp. SE2]|uniref:PQQ-dependent sugar dehydrogenase n=1 Tax=Algoriphagus sp. SE2 TaxID=3141536 RepID=UPI0031CD0DDA